ncbi:hypothetical protein [Thalassobaculum sp.]|uniref:hypothetical protein n=1 Tax=Thalassobaculum sp. TaxID=2022740 RepID=UPI0032EC75C2
MAERPFRTTVTLALTTMLLVASPGAQGQSLCSKPVTPVCATIVPSTDPSAATDTGVARSRCLEDAETFREKLVEYQQCLKGSLDQATKAVRDADRFVACLQRNEADCRLTGPE